MVATPPPPPPNIYDACSLLSTLQTNTVFVDFLQRKKRIDDKRPSIASVHRELYNVILILSIFTWCRTQSTYRGRVEIGGV